MENSSGKIRLCVAGITGKMGREVVKALPRWPGIVLTSAVGFKSAGQNLRDILGQEAPNLKIAGNLDAELKANSVDVFLDLTEPGSALTHALCAIEKGVPPIIGTSGLGAADIQKIEGVAKSKKVPVLIVPNFSIGAVLGMKFAQLAAKWIPDAEIVEIHHEQKLDAPSGTALETAKLIQQARVKKPTVPETKIIKTEGVRGGKHCDVPIHSLRLSGVLAQQSVIFGSTGETLEIKHSVIDRSTYMNGVEISIRKVQSLSGLVIGLESILLG